MTSPPQARLLVSGEGVLARTAHALPHTIDEEDPDTGATTVVTPVSDCWVADHDDVRRWCQKRDLPLLPVRTELGVAVLGPIELPGAPGCGKCADARRDRARNDRDGYRAVRALHGDELATTGSDLVTTLAGSVVASLLANEVDLLAVGDEPRTRMALLFLDLRTLEVSEHAFLPDPRCEWCPSPAVTSASSLLSPRPKPAPDHYRAGERPDHKALTSRFVDAKTGLVRTVEHDSGGGFLLTQAPFGLRDNPRLRTLEIGAGRTQNYAAGKVTAICEALERYAGRQQGDEPAVVRASYTEVADQAIPIDLLGHHPEDSYSDPDFGYPRFDPERQRDWVRGYSLNQEKPVLVPERLAYYGPHPGDQHGEEILFESSNGAAVGGCLEEAILHGVLEFVERDALLLTWHARLNVPRVAPDSAHDRTIPLLVHEITHRTGYRLSIFDITMEQGIPSVLAVAVRTNDDSREPKVCCAAAAHLLPEQAIFKALGELGPALEALRTTYAEFRDRARGLVEDHSRVREMTDHSLLYAEDRSFEHFGFLLDAASATLPISEAFGAAHPRIAHDDLSEDLRAVVRRFEETGLEVLAVDQTTSELAPAGLRCAKVFIPGMLTMTFGHRNRRLAGIPRLREVPARLGYADRPLLESELRIVPHPFP